jgi:hypothetical protein
MQDIRDKLRGWVQTPCDINCHLYTLMGYAMGCQHITELGVRWVVSTWAFLAAQPNTLISVDIERWENVDEALVMAHRNGINMQFVLQDTTNPQYMIEPTDLLFIDTLHTYKQLSIELAKHGNQSRRYIIMHDTASFGRKDEQYSSCTPNWGIQGLIPAIEGFLRTNPHWRTVNQFNHNNGLTILERQPQ